MRKITAVWAMVVSLTVMAAPALAVQTTIFGNATPMTIDSGDTKRTELGVKFKSDVAGTIDGIRFYKAPLNTGTHSGSLWTTGGTRLKQATFTGETSSGWQQVTFSPPVSITAGTTYIASYYTTKGHYSVNNNGFASAVDTPPLHALADSVSPNGVYRYANTSSFPTSNFLESNYYVDVLFTASMPPQCADGLDNDGDTLIDHPADPGCLSQSDNDETNTPPPTGYVTRSANGRDLLLDGQPYKFTGLNEYTAGSACWYSPNFDQDLASWGSGKEAVRTWFFQFTTGTGATRDWSRFDNVISIAKARGMKVIPVLVNQWRECEGSSGQRTRSWYAGGYQTSIEPGDKTTFRDYVGEIVNRYKDESGIAFWQIINEGEVPADSGSGCATDAATVFRAFADDVGGLIHSIDTNHLVSLGTMGSGQCGATDTDYATIHASPGIDLCEYHDYGAASVPIPGDQWNGLQHRIDQCNTLNKPLFVGETGITLAEAGGSLATRSSYFNNKISAAFAAGIDGYLPWQWVDAAHSDIYGIGPGDPVLTVLGNY